MSAADEEARAALHREQAKRRAEFGRFLIRSTAGQATLLRGLRERTDAKRLAILEARHDRAGGGQ